jgi:hypothetical protein
MQVKTPEASSQKWVRKSTMAYLEGEQDFNWIVGIIGGDVDHALTVLADLKNYGDPKRRQELSDWLGSEDGTH